MAARDVLVRLYLPITCCLGLGCWFPGLPHTSWLTPEETTGLLLCSPSLGGTALSTGWGDVASQGAREKCQPGKFELPVRAVWSWCVTPNLRVLTLSALSWYSQNHFSLLPSYCFRCCTVWDRSFCLFMQGSYLSLPASVSCSWFLTSPPAFCFPPNVSSTLSFLSTPFYTYWASSSSCSSYL